MFTCAACNSWTTDPLCVSCRAMLRRGGEVSCSGLSVVSGLIHVSVARRLVHLLKYRGIEAAGEVLARVMAANVPDDASLLVPVPRAFVRRVRYGIDPSVLLAKRIGAIAGLKVVPALSAPLWWPSHAGGARERRQPPQFRAEYQVAQGAILVDDVLTTGATLVAASDVLGVSRAITATRADSGGFE